MIALPAITTTCSYSYLLCQGVVTLGTFFLPMDNDVNISSPHIVIKMRAWFVVNDEFY